jgi:hypothetical protein
MAMIHVLRYGQGRLVRRASRSMPWIGAVIGVLAVASAVRRKGFLRGTADTALNAFPVVGFVKNVAESIRGRDFFPDRQRFSHTHRFPDKQRA